MPPFAQPQIDFILFLQALGAWLKPLMQLFTFLGEENFFIVVMPALYWTVDPGMGVRVGLALLLSSGFNGVLKLAFHAARPFWIDSRVQAMVVQTDFGIPSGHAMNSATVWGALAVSLRKRWGWIIAAVLIFLVGFSRLYLGVHFVTDVLAGWILGALLLWIILRLEIPVKTWFSKHNFLINTVISLVGSLMIIFVMVLVRLAVSNWQVPAEWAQNAALAYPNLNPAIDPLVLSGVISSCGILFGLATGVLLLPSLGGFDVKGVWWKRGLRFVVGVVGVLILWKGLDLVLPSGEYLAAYIFRYLRYALVGVWVSGFAPVVFVWLKLATKNSSRP
jgi:membrane-associated phospholipid phosphatase